MNQCGCSGFFEKEQTPVERSEEEIERCFQEKWGDSRAKFQEIARGLPIECFNEAYENSFFLATNEDADFLDKERFKLLQVVGSERHGEAWDDYQKRVSEGKSYRKEW
ncbi:hypothetical protein LCGC14_2057970 [marine sediment metagenome]|uniref:Uncharacterized protein n=1 Tax=marine sediment metagenome TaxID=412755 RepID=A0A0F9H0H6_9ZZZZ|nr:hypothetical protein [Candidatus Aminicenantes bacterium]